MTSSYDMIVVGGGPGGYTAALHAAGLGLKTALIERDALGGTCLNRGCIPSKTYLKHAEIIESIEKAKKWGIESGELSFSFDKMKKRKNAIVTKLRHGISFLLKEGKIDVYSGSGYVHPDHSVQIVMEKEEKVIYGANILIATGSKPTIPPIKGLETVPFDTSDTIFDILTIPKSITIIGGGVIGVELACIFSSLRTKVTIIEAADRLVPGEDYQASEFLEKALKKKGMTILTGTQVLEASDNDDGRVLICQDKEGSVFTVTGEKLVISTGRKPILEAVSLLNLQKSGPFLAVNEKLQTSMPNLYAAGDVIGGWQLAHAAAAEGIAAVNNAADIHDKIDYKVMPRCIYTLPEIAGVGLTEEEARAAGYDVRIEIFDFAGSGKALVIGEPDGFTKVIYEAKFGEILGVVMAGAHVTEMISVASAFIYLEGTVEEAAKMIHPHPTISETMYEAASAILHKLNKERASTVNS